MARTPAQEKALVAKATKNPNKSAGMRELLEAGMSVTDVAAAFDAPYGFAYGVASRAGLVETAAARRPTKAAAPAKATRPAAKAAPAKTTAKAAPRSAAKKTTAKKAPAKA